MREHTVGLLPDAFPCPGVEPVRTSLGIPVLSLQYISQVLGAHIAQHTQTFILAVGACRRRLWRRDDSCKQVEWVTRNCRDRAVTAMHGRARPTVYVLYHDRAMSIVRRT